MWGIPSWLSDITVNKHTLALTGACLLTVLVTVCHHNVTYCHNVTGPRILMTLH